MTPSELDSRIKKADSQSVSKKTSIGMKKALHSVLISGEKWRTAAAAHDVTESGICRAIQRIKAVTI